MLEAVKKRLSLLHDDGFGWAHGRRFANILVIFLGRILIQNNDEAIADVLTKHVPRASDTLSRTDAVVPVNHNPHLQFP